MVYLGLPLIKIPQLHTSDFNVGGTVLRLKVN